MKADQGHLEESRKEFEAWFEPCEHNRESLKHWRVGDGYRTDAVYLNGCWTGWQAATSLHEERLSRMREALKEMILCVDRLGMDGDAYAAVLVAQKALEE